MLAKASELCYRLRPPQCILESLMGFSIRYRRRHACKGFQHLHFGNTPTYQCWTQNWTGQAAFATVCGTVKAGSGTGASCVGKGCYSREARRGLHSALCTLWHNFLDMSVFFNMGYVSRCLQIRAKFTAVTSLQSAASRGLAFPASSLGYDVRTYTHTHTHRQIHARKHARTHART